MAIFCRTSSLLKPQCVDFLYTLVHFVCSPHFNLHQDRQTSTLTLCQNTLNACSSCLPFQLFNCSLLWDQNDDMFYSCFNFTSVTTQVSSLKSTYDFLNSSPWQTLVLVASIRNTGARLAALISNSLGTVARIFESHNHIEDYRSRHPAEPALHSRHRRCLCCQQKVFEHRRGCRVTHRDLLVQRQNPLRATLIATDLAGTQPQILSSARRRHWKIATWISCSHLVASDVDRSCRQKTTSATSEKKKKNSVRIRYAHIEAAPRPGTAASVMMSTSPVVWSLRDQRASSPRRGRVRTHSDPRLASQVLRNSNRFRTLCTLRHLSSYSNVCGRSCRRLLLKAHRLYKGGKVICVTLACDRVL